MKTAREYKADNAVLRAQLADQRETEKKLRAQLAERDALLKEALPYIADIQVYSRIRASFEGRVMGSELKPCSFCGASDIRCIETINLNGIRRNALRCYECFTEGPQATNQELAIAKWNTRTGEVK